MSYRFVLAIEFVLRLPGANGEIRWRLDGTAVPEPLVARCCFVTLCATQALLRHSSGTRDRCGTAPRTGSARGSTKIVPVGSWRADAGKVPAWNQFRAVRYDTP